MNFFLLESVENETSSAVDIHINFNNEEIQAYSSFLKFTSDSCNEFNALIQSRDVKIHILAERSKCILRRMTMYCHCLFMSGMNVKSI